MRILFVIAAPLRQGPDGPTSDLASARYRALIPAQQLARLGHQVEIASIGPQGWPAAVKESPCETLVISKSFHDANEELAQTMRSRGVKVVVDFCDDHFLHPQFGPHFHRLARLADTIISSTDAMARSVHRHTGRDAVVITDPVEGPRRMPKFSPQLPALKLVWFGHPTNLGGLAARAGELRALACHLAVRLTVVTTLSPEASALVEMLSGKDLGRVRTEIVPWSLAATWKALEDADAGWIPAIDTEQKAVKSPNRLLETLWAGRLVVADAIPSYLPFADLMPIGKGLERSIVEALDTREQVEASLRLAQRRIARDNSPYFCGRQWAAALGDNTAGSLRLNLGCGDKILPGYVNVDVVEVRAGKKPDVICDLHDLAPFADSSADEILSVHVVEHFWRWEIRDVLREWIRVLKPGGRMVVECPNIKSACETILQDPEKFSRDDQHGQRTMWVFYGDPKWKDPLMIHRWGYTPESLRSLLAEVGLTQIRQEPAQFKLREPRDMRVVGTKR